MALQMGDKVLRAALSAAVAGRLTDHELMARFIEGDESAFAAIVNRYTGMVLGVCLRVLSNTQDAEDACQAAFLVLARRAKKGRWQSSIANWLFTIARRVASNASRSAARRMKREARSVPSAPVSTLDQMTGREAFAALDEELEKLPAIYREPLVLCYLQGLTRDEAAIRLGVPSATLKSQLDRGRKKLAGALSKRGIVVGAGLMAVAATSSARAFSPRLVESILTNVGGSPSASVAVLAQGVTMNGFLSKAQLTMLVAVAAVATGIGFASMPLASGLLNPPIEKTEHLTTEKTEHLIAKEDTKGDEKPKTGVKERTISGKILGADGKPIEARLTLVWMEDKPQPLGKTNADGTFRVTIPFKLKNQGGWLVAKAVGHGMGFYPHGIDYIPQSMGTTAEVTLTLPKERSLRGRIVDQQGKPVSGASVVATTFLAYDSDASTDAHLKEWVTERYQYGAPPDADREMWFSDRHRGNPEGRSPYSATTDKDGRFEIAGIGTGQIAILAMRSSGMADKEIIALNRAGFDPNPINKAARDYEREFSFGGKWQLYGPDLVVVVESEKIIRGTVRDPAGKPRAGVRVVFSRPNRQELNPDYNSAVTDKDGKYEIRGARKHKGYMVECPPDPKDGLLPSQTFADDTAGYEPVIIDLKCVKGIVVTGAVKNKTTGEPVVAQMHMEVLANNPFVEKYPPFMNGVPFLSSAPECYQTDKAGHFRIVTIPGPVILMASSLSGRHLEEFKPVMADPKYPDYFHNKLGGLQFDGYAGLNGFVQGSWCKVLDARETDTEVTVNVELEPASKLSVKVVDSDDKPVTNTLATGITHVNFDNPSSFPETDTLTVCNVDPKQGRLVAVVHEKRKLVGTAMVNVDDKKPIVKLGSGGSVTGRVVDENGKPLGGIRVSLIFEHREVSNAFDVLKKTDLATDRNGEFRIDTVFPGQEFRLLFYQGKKQIGPDYDKTQKYSVAKHSDTLKLSELKLDPAKLAGEE